MGIFKYANKNYYLFVIFFLTMELFFIIMKMVVLDIKEAFQYMKPSSNHSINKAFQILSFMAEQEHDTGVTEISQALEFNKSTTYRFLMSLERVGVVQKNETTNKYHLGLTLFELGNRVPIKRSLIDKIHPHLQDLAFQVNEVVNLAGLFQNEVVYLDKIESKRSVQIMTYVGFHIPPHCTALGKAILAFIPPEDVQRILRVEGLPYFTKKTITKRDIFLSELQHIRKEGFALDDEEFEEGLRCIAVPLFDTQKRVIASISISGPTARIYPKTLSRFLQALKETRKEIAHSLFSF